MVKLRYTPDEIARMGDELFDRVVAPRTSPEEARLFVAITSRAVRSRSPQTSFRRRTGCSTTIRTRSSGSVAWASPTSILSARDFALIEGGQFDRGPRKRVPQPIVELLRMGPVIHRGSPAESCRVGT